jgi:hypothetical protein
VTNYVREGTRLVFGLSGGRDLSSVVARPPEPGAPSTNPVVTNLGMDDVVDAQLELADFRELPQCPTPQPSANTLPADEPAPRPRSRAAQLLDAIPVEFHPDVCDVLTAMTCCEANEAWSHKMVQAFNGAGATTNLPVIDLMLQQRLIAGGPGQFVLTELGRVVAAEHRAALSPAALAELAACATSAWQRVPDVINEMQRVTADNPSAAREMVPWLIEYALVQPARLPHQRGALTWEAVRRACAAHGVVTPLDLRSTVEAWQGYSRRMLRRAVAWGVGLLVLGQVLAIVLLGQTGFVPQMVGILSRLGSPVLALAVLVGILGSWARQRGELWRWVANVSMRLPHSYLQHVP